MSGDLTARDVIAQGLDATDLGREGNRVPDYHPDDRDLMRDYTRWSDFTDRAEKLRQQRHKRAADDVLAALAAAGWRLERDDHAADLNRMADGRGQYLRGPARDLRTAADLAALSSDDLALWVEVQTWRSAARLVAGDRDVLFTMPSWCWSDEMIKSLRQPGEAEPDA